MKLNLKKIFFLSFSLLLSILIPRSNNRIIIGSRDGKRFADNSRYFFYYLNKKKNLNVTWLTKSQKIEQYLNIKNFKVFKANSLFGLYYGFRAKYHIFDHSEYDTSEFSSIRAHKINLGHGVYLKKIKKRVDKPNILHNIYNYLVNIKNYHVYPNKEFAKHILNYFPKKKYNLIISNFPRNIFFHNKNYQNIGYLTLKEKKIIKKINLVKGKKLGYFPTWRKDSQDLFLDLNDYSKLKILNDLLKKNKSFLIIKHHSNHFKEDSFSNNKKNIIIDDALKKLSNFINLSYDIDLNTIMCHCDLLISDYSGAVVDYLLTGKPIILYTPDIKIFKKKPGLFFNYNKFNFCHKTTKYKILIEYIKKYFLNPKKFSAKFFLEREKMRKVFFENNFFFDKIFERMK